MLLVLTLSKIQVKGTGPSYLSHLGAILAPILMIGMFIFLQLIESINHAKYNDRRTPIDMF